MPDGSQITTPEAQAPYDFLSSSPASKLIVLPDQFSQEMCPGDGETAPQRDGLQGRSNWCLLIEHLQYLLLAAHQNVMGQYVGPKDFTTFCAMAFPNELAGFPPTFKYGGSIG